MYFYKAKDSLIYLSNSYHYNTNTCRHDNGKYICMFIKQIIIPLAVLLFFTSCASMKPAAFADADTKLQPIEFFVGHTSSTGVIENKAGKPTARIVTETYGTRKDSIISIEQDLFPEGGKKNHRSWKLKVIDEHHLDATANDIDGTAHGLLYGNTFSWNFRLKLSKRKFIKHVRMSQFMYVMPDGKTMIIRSVLRKFSFVVAQITEQFVKE